MSSASRPSPWLQRFLHLIPSGGRVLDLACGGGRNSRLLLEAGFRVLAVDRDLSAMSPSGENSHLDLLEADLEKEPWPLGAQSFAAVVVCNYLWRPLFPQVFGAVEAGGAVIYETFAEGNEAYGRPRRPEFLLRPGELLQRLPEDWQVVAYEQGLVAGERPSIRQRLVARRPPFSEPAALLSGPARR